MLTVGDGFFVEVADWFTEVTRDIAVLSIVPDPLWIPFSNTLEVREWTGNRLLWTWSSARVAVLVVTGGFLFDGNFGGPMARSKWIW